MRADREDAICGRTSTQESGYTSVRPLGGERKDNRPKVVGLVLLDRPSQNGTSLTGPDLAPTMSHDIKIGYGDGVFVGR
jgi:hypothetical protein